MSDLIFKPGDVVRHKATNFKMVINFIADKGRKTYNCSWYNDNFESRYKGFQYESFDEHLLEHYPE